MTAPLCIGSELTVYVPAGEGERLDRDAFGRLIGKPYAVTVPLTAGGAVIARGTIVDVRVVPDEGATLTVRVTELADEEAGE